MRASRSVIALTTTLAAAFAVGCGGGASHPSQTPTPAASQAPKPAAQVQPAQILANAAAALSRVRSFHLEGTGTELTGAQATIDGDFLMPGKLKLRLTVGQQVMDVILSGGYGYLKANKAFWSARDPRAAALLTDRWLKVPAAAAGVSEFAAWTNPATIGRCVLESHLGTISAGGSGEVQGQPVIVLSNRGDVPGSTPGRLYVAATGQPLPVRLVATGPRRPGGSPNPMCGETRVAPTTSKSSVLTLSQYNETVSIAAPSGAIDAGALSG